MVKGEATVIILIVHIKDRLANSLNDVNQLKNVSFTPKINKFELPIGQLLILYKGTLTVIHLKMSWGSIHYGDREQQVDKPVSTSYIDYLSNKI